MKRLGRLGLALLFICVLLHGWHVKAVAEGPIQVTENRVAFVFGQQISYHLTVSGEVPIQSIVLAYRTSDTQGTLVESMDFDPQRSVKIDYVHQIARRYVRPFVDITYWWTVVAADGSKLTTDPQVFSYVDNRFAWQTLSVDAIQVHWYQGDLQIAQQVVDVAVQGLNRARQDIDVEVIRKPFDIYLYNNAQDLRWALPAGLPAGQEALTLYETNVILVSFAPEASNIPHLRRILPHEVTHALIHEATQSDFDHVPLWLAEGLSTSVEYAFTPDPNGQSLLQEKVRERQQIPLRTLCSEFPKDIAQARLAYAESASVVNYIRDMYGRQSLRDLFAAYADGATCEGGVQRVLGLSLERLETLWRVQVAPQNQWDAFWRENGAWVILVLLSAALPWLFILPSQKSSHVARSKLS